MASTKDIIFDIASKLFQERGYNQVTVNDICEACGITKPTFYYHIKSKQEILVRFYDHIVDNLTPLLLQMISISGSWEQLILLFDTLINNIQDLGTDINSQLLSINLEKNYGTFALRENLEEIAVNIVKKGQDNKEFRNLNDAKQLYQAAAYMFTGYEYMWCVLDGDFDWKGQFFKSLENLMDVDPAFRRYS